LRDSSVCVLAGFTNPPEYRCTRAKSGEVGMIEEKWHNNTNLDSEVLVPWEGSPLATEDARNPGVLLESESVSKFTSTV